ncbi:MAG: amino acid ABC transporter permease [Christensenella sp.]|uniref:amino acid ABC transporter permease n=1 Tax=Christensenella sp. TaxID=1935934 RepID=UPI002B20D285|nr:amino acid ABC transporter permease [Christensenella sp.]MEA5002955.1 amino acid ABC transporter permease [Christensenella sp.]
MNDVFAPFKWEALFARGDELAQAFLNTVLISLLALLIALALGFLFGMMSYAKHRAPRAINRVYVEIVQNIPLLLQVFVLYAVLPLFGVMIGTFMIGVMGIGIYHGAYISEVVHSGLSSVQKGQFEAARSQGFTYWETMRHIILPQSIKTMMPALAVQAANLIKNTSVLALIAGGELMYFSNSFAYGTSYYGPAYVVAGVLYFLLCFPLSRLAKRLEERRKKEIKPGEEDITCQNYLRG